jgi:thiol-disulfide isomerase/thioredoxin
MNNNFFGNLFRPKQTSGQGNASSSLPVLYPAPEFRGLENWINTSPISSMRQLQGKVVLIDFWTYSCINCLNAMPYVKTWHKKYKDHGLVVLGIHAPEFGFEKKYQNVLKAVKKHQIKFPVAQDNGFRLWRAYKNRYWPALYLVDKQGRVRYMHFGEGRYQATESAIRQLLKSA